MDCICCHSQETLTHVHDRLNRRSGGGFIDDGPANPSKKPHLFYIAHRVHSHQTSCLCPATLCAGRKGSGRAAVADMTRTPGLRRRGRTDGYEKTEGFLILAMDCGKETQDLKNIESRGERIKKRPRSVVGNPKLSRARNSRNQPGWVGQNKGILGEHQDCQPMRSRRSLSGEKKAIEIDRLREDESCRGRRVGGCFNGGFHCDCPG